MAFFDVLRRIFGKKAPPQTLQAQIESSVASSGEIFKRGLGVEPLLSIPESTPPETLEDTYQLGLAAGYTGRSIKEIESSLVRIETQMPTKDWFSSQFEDKTPELIEVLKKHEENEQKRFELLQSMLALHKPSESPELVLSMVPERLSLTPKMRMLFSIVKESKELSYKDLSTKLGLTVSALRGLLSNTITRTDRIQRFRMDGKGWVRYLEDDDSSTESSL